MGDIRRGDIIFFFVVGLAVYVAYLLRDVLLLIYVSALFAVVVTPGIHLVQRVRVGRWSPGRGVSILVLVLAGVGLMVLFAAFAVPPIFRDVQGLVADWPRRAGELTQRLRRVPLLDRLDLGSLQSHLGQAAGGVLGLFKGIAGGVFWFFSWLILTGYFIVDGERAFNWLMSLFPVPQRDRLEPTLLRAEGRVRKWLIGQGALMLILGTCAGITYRLLGIKYSYALAVMTGALNIVPIIGPVTAMVVVSIVALVDSWTKLLGVVIFYFIYQQVENAFLTPTIMKTTVDLPALAVIIALSVGGALAGILGALVAVPTAAVVAVLLDEYLVKPHSRQAAMVHQSGDRVIR